VHSCTHWLRPRSPNPHPAFGLICEVAIGHPRKTTSLSDPLSKTDEYGIYAHTVQPAIGEVG
jgi:hypothetical protein